MILHETGTVLSVIKQAELPWTQRAHVQAAKIAGARCDKMIKRIVVSLDGRCQ